MDEFFIYRADTLVKQLSHGVKELEEILQRLKNPFKTALRGTLVQYKPLLLTVYTPDMPSDVMQDYFDQDKWVVDAYILNESTRDLDIIPMYYDVYDFLVYERDMGNDRSAIQAMEHKPQWRLCFCPKESGTFTYTISRTNKQTDVSETLATGKWTVEAAFPTPGDTDMSIMGFLQVDTENKRFIDSFTGQPRFLVGCNIAFSDNPAAFGELLDALHVNGGNFVRYLMEPAHLMLLRDPGMIQLDEAALLDVIINDAQAKKIYVNFGLFQHRWLSNWRFNSFNTPEERVTNTAWDFFTSETSKKHVKNYLRYMVARYGYLSCISQWELIAEISSINDLRRSNNQFSILDEWHREMIDYIKSIDTTGRGISTSYGGYYEQHAINMFDQQSLDFCSNSFYNGFDFITGIAKETVKLMERYNKPVITTQAGVDPGMLHDGDPIDSWLHGMLWSAFVSGASATPLAWSHRRLLGIFDGPFDFWPIRTFARRMQWPPEKGQFRYLKTHNNQIGDLIIGNGIAWSNRISDEQRVFTVDFTSDDPEKDIRLKMLPNSLVERTHWNHYTLEFHVNSNSPEVMEIIFSGPELPESFEDTATVQRARLEVSIDNIIVDTFSAPPRSDRPLNMGTIARVGIPPGSHIVTLRNNGRNSLRPTDNRIDLYRVAFKSATQRVAAMGTLSDSDSVFMVYDRHFHYHNQYFSKVVTPPSPLSDDEDTAISCSVDIPLTGDEYTYYIIEVYDPFKGNFILTKSVELNPGQNVYSLELPAFHHMSIVRVQKRIVPNFLID